MARSLSRVAALGVAVIALAAPAIAEAQSPQVPDFTQYGFPQVVAQTTLAAGAAGSLSYDGITVQIPAGAFTDSVKFELLEGPVANFQKDVPAGQTVIADFAFKVVDQTTGVLIGKFQKPVMFTLKSSAVSPSSVYYNVTEAGTAMPNPVSATISGTTLTHAIPVAMVGWVVTSPAKAVPGATSPTTGIPVLPFVAVGLAAVGGGVLLLRRARA